MEPTPRQRAETIIRAWQKTGAFPDRMLNDLPHGQAETTEIVYGVLRQYRILEWMVSRLTHKRPAKKIVSLLVTGLYQLIFLDRTEVFAVVHETVASARKTGGESQAKMVNAVLRRAQREKDDLLAALEKEAPSLRLSHPDILYQRWCKHFGAAPAEQLARWNNERPSMTIRLQEQKVSSADFIDQAGARGIQVSPHPYRPETFFEIPHGVRPADLPGFDEGWFYLQDPATSAAVDLLGLQPEHRVLDACAAPGGKAIYMAEQLADARQLTALELQEDRIPRLQENFERMGFSGASVVQGDARSWQPDEGLFDRILLDVPCSNTGVLRRRPDARWRFSKKDLRALTTLQQEILEHALTLLKKDGKLVYSTCSLEPEENEELVQAYHPEKSAFLFPPETGTDGAFAARISA